MSAGPPPRGTRAGLGRLSQRASRLYPGGAQRGWQHWRPPDAAPRSQDTRGRLQDVGIVPGGQRATWQGSRRPGCDRFTPNTDSRSMKLTGTTSVHEKPQTSEVRSKCTELPHKGSRTDWVTFTALCGSGTGCPCGMGGAVQMWRAILLWGWPSRRGGSRPGGQSWCWGGHPLQAGKGAWAPHRDMLEPDPGQRPRGGSTACVGRGGLTAQGG